MDINSLLDGELDLVDVKSMRFNFSEQLGIERGIHRGAPG
jgi:hypothetical protein